MSTMMKGAIAGAVGTMALDVTTYADMALRARSSSNTPATAIKKLSERAGVPIRNDNRASALGALTGYVVGVGVGSLYGALRSRVRPPLLLSTLVLATAAMAAAEVPATRVGATDPKTWGIAGWLSDIVPHVVYGLVTAAVFDAVTETSIAVDGVSAMVVEIDDLGDESEAVP